MDLQFLGKSLKEVSVEHLQSSQFDLVCSWFHSDKDIDLFIWKDEENTIIKQQLCFMGVVAEWTIVDGSKTGDVNDMESSGGVKGSPIIHYHEDPKSLILGQAYEISESIEAMSSEDRNQCCQNWKRKP